MDAGRICELRVIEEKGAPGIRKEQVQTAENGGIVGDLHCGAGRKQISILSAEAFRWMKEQETAGLCFPRFKANIVVEGDVSFSEGDRVTAGSALLEITGRKGACFEECPRFRKGMDCMLKAGCWYATAVTAGTMKDGDRMKITESRKEYDWNRYTRQLLVPGMGRPQQERLKEASVLVVGAGGLGCPAITALAEAGVGRIGIMDGDVVEATNLNRQFLYSPDMIGKKKAACAGTWLKSFRPDIKAEIWEEELTPENGRDVLSRFDLVLCAVDKISARLCINRMAADVGTPLVDGAIDGCYGTVTSVTDWENDPCLACINPEGKEPGHISSSLGTTTMIIGALEAQSAIRYLAGTEKKVSGILSYDGVSGTIDEIPVFKDPDCPVCGTKTENRNMVDK